MSGIGCLCGCGRPAIRRGLSEWCRRKVDRLIAAGKLTEAEAVAQGMLLPKRRLWQRNPYR